MDAPTAYWLTKAVWLFLLPPNGLLTLALMSALVAWVRKKNHRFAAGLAVLSLGLFYLLVSPIVSQALMLWVERDAGLPLTQASAGALLTRERPPGAIVILGGGQKADERERPYQATATVHTLARLIHGARIARWTALPIMVSGGTPKGTVTSEAEVMARVLKQDLSQPVRWLEDQSFNTLENARFSARVLRGAGITHIILVTQSFHMSRARAAFEAAGLTVTSAPHGFYGQAGFALYSNWLPVPESVARTSMAFHEILGQSWYQLRRWWLTTFAENS